MEPLNEATECCLDSACAEVRRLARGAGLDCIGAEECVEAYRKRWLLGKRPLDLCGATARQRKQLKREVNWFVRRWLYDRTKRRESGTREEGRGKREQGEQQKPGQEQEQGGEREPAILRVISMDAIAKIVSTLSPSQQWLWRRVEVDGARLKDLALEIGSTANALDRLLSNTRRVIRRLMDTDEDI